LTVPPDEVASLRLFVFDGGTLAIADTHRFGLRPDEVATSDLAVASYLVVHPAGTLIWDTGAVPDADVTSSGHPTTHRVVLPHGEEREVVIARSLRAQMGEVGFDPSAITYLGLSHYHYDHTANANDFAAATWLVRPVERDAMFDLRPPPLTQPATYQGLRKSRTILIETDDFDVFGDRSVVIKHAPGHTPGHQVVFLDLARTGRVVLSGDLYHYPEERALGRVPTFEFDAQQTRDTRAWIDAFLEKTDAQLWIEHDLSAHARLQKAPAYYD
jgi:N-acyl homoserine lactone hydrolase